MPDFAVSGLKGFDISEDGRRIDMNLMGEGDAIISLKVDTLTLQTIAQQIGFALTKARQHASANPNFVPALRPAKFRSDVMAEGRMVVVVFALTDALGGLEHYYGLLPEETDALAQQMQQAAEKARKVAEMKNTKH
jgi:hypothetical protein